MTGSSTRDSILDAAERLIAREGVQHLTIGRVAEAAAVSRGGLFYHFPSKEALVQAMVQRMVAGWQQALEAQMAQDSEPHGRLTRAYARLVLFQLEGGTGSTGAVVGALIAGLAFDPRLLDPLHAQLRTWQAQSEAELDPATAAVVRLATHALWTNDLLLTNTISPELLRQIVARLEALTYPSAAEKSPCREGHTWHSPCKRSAMRGAASKEQHVQSEVSQEARAAAIQFMTTEHTALQTARSATIFDANGQATLFLSSVTSALVALAFIGQVEGIGAALYPSLMRCSDCLSWCVSRSSASICGTKPA